VAPTAGAVAMTVSGAAQVPGTLNITTDSQNPLSHVFVPFQPGIGTVTLDPSVNSNYSFVYQPSGSAPYTTSFAYETDGTNGGIAIGVVVINANGGANATLPSNIALTTGYGQSVTASLPVAASQIISQFDPIYGDVTINAANNTFSYAPRAGFSGTDAMVFRVPGPTGGLDMVVEFTVTPPALTSANIQVKDAAGTVRMNSDLATVYGTASVTIDPKDKTVFPADGNYSVTLRLSDASGASASASSGVKIDNTPPACVWISPTANAFVSGTPQELVDTSDNLSGVRGMDFVDPFGGHAAFATVSQTQTGRMLYSGYDTRLKEGAVNFQAVVYDVAGNAGYCSQPVIADNTAPIGAITLNPTEITYGGSNLVRGVVSVAANGTDDNGIAGLVLSLDGVTIGTAADGVAPLSQTLNTNGGYANGTHTLSSVATDRAGNAATVTKQIVFDNAAPVIVIAAPSNGAAIAEKLDAINAQITEAYGIAGKKVLIDNVEVMFTEQANLLQLVQPVTAVGQHTLTVTANDTVGNVGQQSQSFVIVGSVSATPVAITFVGISDGVVLTPNGVNTITAVVSGGTAPLTITSQIDNATPMPATQGPGGAVSVLVDTTGLANGSHSISINVTDSTGQITTKSVTVTVDNTVLVVTAPLSIAIGVTDGAVLTPNSVNTITTVVSGGDGPLTVTSQIDNATPTPVTPGPGGVISVPVNTTGMSDGAHTVSISVTDNAGKTTTQTVTVVVANNPVLVASFVGVSNGTVLTGNSVNNLTTVVSGGTGALTVTSQIDNGAATPIVLGAGGVATLSVNTAGLSNGSHTISINATDGAGKTVTQTITVVVDNTVPAISVGVPLDGDALTGTVVLLANASDDGTSGVSNVSIYIDGEFVNNSAGAGANGNVSYALDTATLANGDHTIEFRATDLANNVTSAVRHITVHNDAGSINALTVEVVSPLEGASVSGAIYATFIVAGKPTSAGVRIDGGALLAAETTNGDTYRALLNTTDYTEGFHSIEFVASAGTNSVSQTTRVYFGKTKPLVAITSPQNGATLSFVRTLSVQASDPSGQPLESVRLNLQGGATDFAFFPGNTDLANKNYNFQWDTQNVPDGDYTLFAIARNKAGLSEQTSVAFHVDNTNIPISTAAVEFLYSNAGMQLQSGTLLAGPLTAVSARVTNATVDPRFVDATSLLVYATKDGVKAQVPGAVRVNGNSVEFTGAIPSNSRVHCVLTVLDTSGKFIRQSHDMISAMSAAAGGTVTTPDGMLELHIPAQSLREDALVETIGLPSDAPELQGALSSDSRSSQAEVVYAPFQISATGRSCALDRFQIASTLVYQRTAAQMSPLDTKRITHAEHYDVGKHLWSSVDDRSASLAGISDAPQVFTISAPVLMLGIYRIAAIPKPGDGVTELIAYPSPFRAGSENATVAYLMGAEADADLTIYDALGNVVRHTTYAAGSVGGQLFNQVPWDGRNGRGEVVANGAYIVQLISDGHRARTKIGVAK
jgi:hypothetical protein